VGDHGIHADLNMLADGHARKDKCVESKMTTFADNHWSLERDDVGLDPFGGILKVVFGIGDENVFPDKTSVFDFNIIVGIYEGARVDGDMVPDRQRDSLLILAPGLGIELHPFLDPAAVADVNIIGRFEDDPGVPVDVPAIFTENDAVAHVDEYPNESPVGRTALSSNSIIIYSLYPFLVWNHFLFSGRRCHLAAYPLWESLITSPLGTGHWACPLPNTSAQRRTEKYLKRS
jgi:hypothetical protein